MEACNFNPRSHKGSDGAIKRRILDLGIFQSTLPQRERLNEELENDRSVLISIHAPTKGATIRILEMQVTEKFQSTLPQRERLLSMTILCALILFQSTLPQRERHKLFENNISDFWISIHAPTKGATEYLESHSVQKINFNPRSHKGSDHKIQAVYKLFV